MGQMVTGYLASWTNGNRLFFSEKNILLLFVLKILKHHSPVDDFKKRKKLSLHFGLG
jgi:hypothetical protein